MAKRVTAPILIPLTPEQRDALRSLSGALSDASYIRALIARDARERRVSWPDDIPAVGKLGEGRRKK
jgi:hypothetical protein